MVFNVEVETIEEWYVLTKALEEYYRILKVHQKEVEFLKSKKFNIGDYVIKKNTSYFDGVFGAEKGNIGKVVGWDFDNNYYRVYFNENNPFLGVEEEELEKYEGEVSSDLYVKQPFEIVRLIVELK
jgi:predicted metallo-beta-lactamase superfamily hydrolase